MDRPSFMAHTAPSPRGRGLGGGHAAIPQPPPPNPLPRGEGETCLDNSSRVSPCRPRDWKTQVLAQGRAGIILVIEPAPLQFRHDVFDEVHVGAGDMRCRKHEAIRDRFGEPLLQSVGDFLWAANERLVRPRTMAELDEVAWCRIGNADRK